MARIEFINNRWYIVDNKGNIKSGFRSLREAQNTFKLWHRKRFGGGLRKRKRNPVKNIWRL